MFKHLILASAALSILAACGEKAPAHPSDPVANDTPAALATDGITKGSIAWAAAGDWRSAEEKARDPFRHPVETLEFFGVQPDAKIVEIWPGGGWYTNILAPYLAQGGGTLVAAGFDIDAVEGERRERRIEGLAKFKEAHDGAVFGTLEYTAFSDQSDGLTTPGSADTVLTFRNVHNWMSGGYTEKFFADAFIALKPGGVLGIVEHRLPSTGDQDPAGTSGYVHEDYVKALAVAAGFELVASSEINANPADTADHPYGVWTLPPNSRDADREGNRVPDFDPATYLAIGESDRMTLKFVKPS